MNDSRNIFKTKRKPYFVETKHSEKETTLHLNMGAYDDMESLAVIAGEYAEKKYPGTGQHAYEQARDALENTDTREEMRQRLAGVIPTAPVGATIWTPEGDIMLIDGKQYLMKERILPLVANKSGQIVQRNEL